MFKIQYLIILYICLMFSCQGDRTGISSVIPGGASDEVKDLLITLDKTIKKVRNETDLDIKTAVIYEKINQTCDDLLGKNEKPAFSPRDWGSITAQELTLINNMLGTIENNAELCRDYARHNRKQSLEVQKQELLISYEQFIVILRGL